MSNIMPFQFESKEVRAITHEDGSVWFIAKDVCEVLELANTTKAIEGLDEDERNTLTLSEGNRGNPNVNIISESGLYKLTFRSNKPEAKRLTKWVTSEVLPTIRKTGSYSLPSAEKPSVLKNRTDEAKEIRLLSKTFAGLVKDFMALKYTKEQAELSAANALRPVFGCDPRERLALPALEDAVQERRLNPTEIGVLLGGLSAKKVNLLLAQEGFQFRDEFRVWQPTEKGKAYGIIELLNKSHGSGTPVQQLKWYRTIAPILQAAKAMDEETSLERYSE